MGAFHFQPKGWQTGPSLYWRDIFNSWDKRNSCSEASIPYWGCSLEHYFLILHPDVLKRPGATVFAENSIKEASFSRRWGGVPLLWMFLSSTCPSKPSVRSQPPLAWPCLPPAKILQPGWISLMLSFLIYTYFLFLFSHSVTRRWTSIFSCLFQLILLRYKTFGICSVENYGFKERQEAVASSGVGQEWEGDGASLNPKPPVLRMWQCPFEFPPWFLKLQVKLHNPTGRESGKASGGIVSLGARSWMWCYVILRGKKKQNKQNRKAGKI